MKKKEIKKTGIPLKEYSLLRKLTLFNISYSWWSRFNLDVLGLDFYIGNFSFEGSLFDIRIGDGFSFSLLFVRFDVSGPIA